MSERTLSCQERERERLLFRSINLRVHESPSLEEKEGELVRRAFRGVPGSSGTRARTGVTREGAGLVY